MRLNSGHASQWAIFIVSALFVSGGLYIALLPMLVAALLILVGGE